jgi:hypothetical protein
MGERVSHLCEDALWCVVSGGRFCPQNTTAPRTLRCDVCTLRNGKLAAFHFADLWYAIARKQEWPVHAGRRKAILLDISMNISRCCRLCGVCGWSQSPVAFILNDDEV